MCNKSASFCKSYIQYQEMNELTDANVLRIKTEVLNDHEQDEKMQVWELPTISSGDTLSSTSEATVIKQEEKEITNNETCIEELCTNERMLNDEIEQDVKPEIWPEFGDTLNSTAAMFVKVETIKQEKVNDEVEQDVKPETWPEFGDTLNSTAAMFVTVETIKKEKVNDEVEQEMNLEICPELSTITTGDTLNSTAAMFVKVETIKQEKGNDEEQLVKPEILPEFVTIATGHTLNSPAAMLVKKETIIQEKVNDEVEQPVKMEIWPESATITTGSPTLINTDKESGKQNQEEIIIDGVCRVKCKVCDRFYRKSYMTKHLRVHTGERPLNCEICGIAFKDSATKASHKLMHKDDNDFPCTVCGKSFISSEQLKIHGRRHAYERCHECNCLFLLL